MFNFFKKNDTAKIAKKIIAAVGGEANIDMLEHCSTRIRVGVKNLDIVNKDLVVNSGAKDMLVTREDYVQFIVGTSAPKIYEEIEKLLDKKFD